MDFNQHVDSALTTYVDNTKFFREMADVVSDFSDGGEIQKLLEESARLRVEHAENLIRLKSKHEALCQTMQQVQNSSSTIEQFNEVWKKRSGAAERKRINVKNIAQFKNFKKTVESTAAQAGADVNGQANGAAHDEDLIIEGIEETGGEIFSLYDPWSKALMQNPVRNKMCGHIYDRDSVMLIIKDKIDIRCPVLGCANETYIQPAHLVEDAIVRQKVRQRMAEEVEDDTASEEDEEQADED
ncbi:E3 SUMO-protein ligase NSE2 [Drosophila erecta]|uniref:E3 SUMO-protein ligase NSE2 n=1 Tax=Drosophila erecta TaxID=7220 RepID=B3NTJ6_DROER|nr:E3 SUMO-protein ligase NSE2 [Drosophila erecta]EDV47000.1 cervantes [Drosophila erecta]